MKIFTNNHKLHFCTVPIHHPNILAPVLVQQLGYLTVQKRISKFEFYKKEDTFHDQKSYDDILLKGKTHLVKTISHNKILVLINEFKKMSKFH